MGGREGRSGAGPGRKAIRVLVVDDSAFMRYLIGRELAADPSIEVVGAARDGLDALKKIPALRPEVLTLDVEMPRMDGLATLERIMAEEPRPVVLLSSWTQEGAATTLRGLELGAVDFVLKPPTLRVASAPESWDQLRAVVRSAGGLDAGRLGWRHATAASASRDGGRPPRRPRPDRVGRVVVIGTSTGGPRALFEVVPRLPAELPAALLLVQHMPPGFTRSLAGRLNDVSALEVREGAEGDLLEAGVALLAPGDFHMVVRPGGRIVLERTPPIHGVRPAADVTMTSAASVYGESTLGVVLTGMGTDGTPGALAIRRRGGIVIVEDESTCVVYGMPRSVREAGAADRVVRLEAVADAIVEVVQGSVRAAVGAAR